ncbi:hypothetical protein CF65_01892 [Aggregatibacter actinomycetemcomitans HK1651]|nr:hypothetical protein CF65_01892 [Aggregatibacter actinomycetemcomitans HK1651]
MLYLKRILKGENNNEKCTFNSVSCSLWLRRQQVGNLPDAITRY